MLAVHCDKCGKILLLEGKKSVYQNMNESGWCKLHKFGEDDSEIDLCKECYDDIRDAIRKEIE